MPLVLHGYRYSVYVRIARLALAEKGVAYDRVEVNPFSADVPADYLALHPFGRVPTLIHDGFALYETGAITRYLDRTFAGPNLQPRSAWSIPTVTGRWSARSSRIAYSGRRSANRPMRRRSDVVSPARPRSWQRSSRWRRPTPSSLDPPCHWPTFTLAR
jgi:glutathione S-transferase